MIHFVDHDYIRPISFYTGKVATTRYYLRNVVPNVWAVAEIVIDGDTSAIDVPVDVFEY